MLRDAPAAPQHQRARGRAELGLVAAPDGARIAHLFNAAPLRLLFPDADPAEPKQAAFVNVAGGLAGGDSLEAAVTLGAGARCTLTTPAAEKIYRSLGPETRIATSLSLAADSVCEWLPQETILFDGARLARRLDITLAPGARLLAAEMLVLGRAARGEAFTRGALHDGWRIRREGRLLWADALRLDPAASAQRFGLGGAGALATLLLAAPDAAAHRDLARDVAAGGAGLVAPGLLLARWLGEAGVVRAGLAAAIMALRAAALGLPPTLPRLWRS
ncbi:urease accessory protein UreD [Falsiroseomonas selenitidurans]|uniref:Urease accessory protein UreD n=1 Tax=Falsiroseomonas selenitidurans TaxID=2716335 RepID=A0ABX1E2M3_9PROT|nr:urease accessory protein UreD [Falsiroseomonas selenitidurans]NKC30068.1 urease accessory protein UreD [Falsiroseomonas selenitidurans]